MSLRTEVKSAREGVRQEQSEKRKAPAEKTEGEVCANSCWCGLFVPGEDFKDKERTEL